MTPKRVSASSLPLKPVVYHILAALAEGGKHGYAIKRDIGVRSQDRLDVDPGTLYRLIARLLEDGLVEEVEMSPATEPEDGRRRYYHLTEDGRVAYVAETERMASLVDGARADGVIRKPRTA